MVSLSDRDCIVQNALSDRELSCVYRFIFEGKVSDSSANDKQGRVLLAIARSDERDFQPLLKDFAGRTVTPETDWIHNDCLIFLLLLGCHKFSMSTSSLDPVLTARESNRNPVAVKTNQAFRSLYRSEFSLEGEYAFIKVVFLDLIYHLQLTHIRGVPIYESLTSTGILSELSPFLKLLAVRSFDLLVSATAPTEENAYEELIEAIHRLSPNWTLRETAKLVWALPVKRAFVLATAIVAAISFFGGAGYWFMEKMNFSPKPSTESQQVTPPANHNSETGR
jgi:hypothetical protein